MVIGRKTVWKVHVVDLGKFFKILRVVKKLIQNLTRRKSCGSKSDKTKKVNFEIWQDEKNFSENHALYKNFFIQNHAFSK